MNNTFKKLGWAIPSSPPYFAAGMTTKKFMEGLSAGERDQTKLVQLRVLQARFNFPYRMNENQPWPEKGDLEKPWTYEGKTYQP